MRYLENYVNCDTQIKHLQLTLEQLWELEGAKEQVQSKIHVYNYQRNANQNYNEVPHQSEWLPLIRLQIINVREGVEKREPSFTIAGDVNWYNHYGKQYGDTPEN